MIIYMLSHTLIWSDLRRKPTANFASFTSISQENVQINNNDNEENSRESRNKGRPGTIHDVYTQTRRNANKNTINTSSHAFNLSIIGDIHQWSYVLTHTDLIRPQKKTYNIFFCKFYFNFTGKHTDWQQWSIVCRHRYFSPHSSHVFADERSITRWRKLENNTDTRTNSRRLCLPDDVWTCKKIRIR